MSLGGVATVTVIPMKSRKLGRELWQDGEVMVYMKDFMTELIGSGLILLGLHQCQPSSSSTDPNVDTIVENSKVIAEYFGDCITSDLSLAEQIELLKKIKQNNDYPLKPLGYISETGKLEIWGAGTKPEFEAFFNESYLDRHGWDDFLINDACGDISLAVNDFATAYNFKLWKIAKTRKQ